MLQLLWKTAFVILSLTISHAAAAPVPSDSKPAETPVQKARKALEQTITAKSEAKSLHDAIDLLKEVAKVDIVLDTSTIQMLGIDPNQTIISFDFKNVKLKDGLRTAFASMNLRCGITATGIVVSTDEGLTIRQLRHRVNVDADGKTLAETLKSLAEETGANVVIDPRAKKWADEKITLKIEDAPLESAVRLTSDVAGLAVIRMSNVLFVTTEARADKLRPDADRPLGPTPGNAVFPQDGGAAGGGGNFPNLPPMINPPIIPPLVPNQKDHFSEVGQFQQRLKISVKPQSKLRRA